MAHLQHPLFLQIKKEHTALRELLVTLTPQIDMAELKHLLDHYELLHHKKEEELIFKPLLDHPLLGEGGPLCVYYFDEQVVAPPRQAVQSLTGQEVKWLSHQKEFQNKHTPLAVPVDEHRSTYSLIQYYLDHFSELSLEKKNAILALYKRIQFSHMEKEENCFFHVMIRLLSDQELDEIWHKWQNYSLNAVINF